MYRLYARRRESVVQYSAGAFSEIEIRTRPIRALKDAKTIAVTINFWQ